MTHQIHSAPELSALRKQVLHRIRIIQGHLRAIEEMIACDEYCVKIIHQSLAVQTALRKMDMALLEDHLSNCVVEHIKSGREEEAVTELIRLYEMK